MRSTSFRGCVAALVAGIVGAAVSSSPAAAAESPCAAPCPVPTETVDAPRSVEQVFAREIVRVAPGIHAIVKPAVTDPPFEGNVAVFEQQAGLVVVDTGGSTPSGRIVARAIRSESVV